MSTLVYILIGERTLSLRFEGKQKLFKDEPEVISEIVDLLEAYKASPTEDLRQKILEFINPIIRLELSEDFDLVNDRVYLKGTNQQLPEQLESTIKLYLDKGLELTSLVNFWKNCLANPNEEARQRFFDYVKDYGVVITDAGYAILYKAVNTVKNKEIGTHGSDFSRFITAEYFNVKNSKKSPKNYEVFEICTKEGTFIRFARSTHSGNIPVTHDDEQVVPKGNLAELYEEVSNDQSELFTEATQYVPWHSGTHGMEIKIGQPVTMPREECDPNIKNECSYGLHVGSHKYVHTFGNGLDAILAVLVNPKDVVAIPDYDNSKIRVCQYYPYAEIERDENGNWEEIEHGYFEEDFIEYEVEEIEEQLKEMYKDKAEGVEIDTEREAVLNQRLIELNHVNG